MKDKQKKPPEWHKDWDRVYKKILEKEVAYCIDGKEVNMNEYAKMTIQNLIDQNTKDLFRRHNLLAMSTDKIAAARRRNEEIKKDVDRHIASIMELKEQLQGLLMELEPFTQ